MKLNENTLINVVETNDYKEHHINYINKVKVLDLKRLVIYEKKISFLKEIGFRRMILSKKVEDEITNDYKIPKDINFKVLRILPNRKDSILINEDFLIRYLKTDDEIIGCVDYKRGQKLFQFFFFIDLIEEKVCIDNSIELSVLEKSKMYSSFLDFVYGKFMVMVTYLELTNITTEILEGNRSVGTKKDNKYKNETNKKFIIVKGNWNVKKIIIGTIHVRGFWRLQPCGIGRSQYKYKFIESYDKKGITRRLSQKELV
jgi:hypothetical protein